MKKKLDGNLAHCFYLRRCPQSRSGSRRLPTRLGIEKPNSDMCSNASEQHKGARKQVGKLLRSNLRPLMASVQPSLQWDTTWFTSCSSQRTKEAQLLRLLSIVFVCEPSAAKCSSSIHCRHVSTFGSGIQVLGLRPSRTRP